MWVDMHKVICVIVHILRTIGSLARQHELAQSHSVGKRVRVRGSAWTAQKLQSGVGDKMCAFTDNSREHCNGGFGRREHFFFCDEGHPARCVDNL